MCGCVRVCERERAHPAVEKPVTRSIRRGRPAFAIRFDPKSLGSKRCSAARCRGEVSAMSGVGRNVQGFQV